MTDTGALIRDRPDLLFVLLRGAGWCPLLAALHLHAVTEEGGVGDVSQVSILGVSVHHSFNRGINIHGGRGATVNGSTIYKSMGHAFFLEDGSETSNVFVGNLGSLTMRAMSLLESDQTPSTYWITNPDNVFEDNIAAGGDAFGFWINLPRHPGGFLSFTGATFKDDIFPQHALLGSFRRNIAHSYRVGFLAHDLDPKVFDKKFHVRRKRDGWSGRWFKEVDDHPGMRRPALFDSLVAHSNSQAGAIVANMGHLQIRGFVSARQPSGLETLEFRAEQWAAASNDWSAPLVADSVFLGEGAGAHACGLSGPMSSFLSVANSTFRGFEAGASAICACKLCNGLKGGQEVRTAGLRFLAMGAGSSRVSFTHHFEAIFHDLDGSLTGAPRGWMHGLSDDGTIGHFPPAHCHLSPLGSTRHVQQAIVCDSAVRLRTFRLRAVEPQSMFEGRQAVVSTEHGSSVVPWMVYDILIRRSSHHFTLAAGYRHTLDWMSSMGYPVDHMGWDEAEVCEMRADESAILEYAARSRSPHLWVMSPWSFRSPRHHSEVRGSSPARTGCPPSPTPSRGPLKAIVWATLSTSARLPPWPPSSGCTGSGSTHPPLLRTARMARGPVAMATYRCSSRLARPLAQTT